MLSSAALVGLLFKAVVMVGLHISQGYVRMARADRDPISVRLGPAKGPKWTLILVLQVYRRALPPFL